jgi:1-acyl-sn-glycerol-3-phosphate acyltransferase
MLNDVTSPGTATRNGHGAARAAQAASDPPPAPAASDPQTPDNPEEWVIRRLARAFRGMVPDAHLHERDPDFIREQLPWMWLAASLYFRAEVRGLGNIPQDGPVLMVGNHSGGNMAPDIFVFGLAFTAYFGVERRLHPLAHNLVLTFPGLGSLRKLGAIAASRSNAERVLDSGAALLVYPGGDHEVHRPVWERNRVAFNGRKGFLRLALRNDVPIIPIVAIGGQETSLFLSRGEGLARALRLDRIMRLKVLPISLAIPWGLNVGDFLGHIPLPAKITIEVLAPIDLRAELGPDPDLDEAYELVTGRMQKALDALAAERRLPVIG